MNLVEGKKSQNFIYGWPREARARTPRRWLHKNARRLQREDFFTPRQRRHHASPSSAQPANAANGCVHLCGGGASWVQGEKEGRNFESGGSFAVTLIREGRLHRPETKTGRDSCNLRPCTVFCPIQVFLAREIHAELRSIGVGFHMPCLMPVRP